MPTIVERMSFLLLSSQTNVSAGSLSGLHIFKSSLVISFLLAFSLRHCSCFVTCFRSRYLVVQFASPFFLWHATLFESLCLSTIVCLSVCQLQEIDKEEGRPLHPQGVTVQ